MRFFSLQKWIGIPQLHRNFHNGKRAARFFRFLYHIVTCILWWRNFFGCTGVTELKRKESLGLLNVETRNLLFPLCFSLWIVRSLDNYIAMRLDLNLAFGMVVLLSFMGYIPGLLYQPGSGPWTVWRSIWQWIEVLSFEQQNKLRTPIPPFFSVETIDI